MPHANLSDVQILRHMLRFRENATNHDSEFNVVCCIKVKDKDDKIHHLFGINTEFLLRHDSNLCAEGLAIAQARLHGKPLTVLEVKLFGGKKDEVLNTRRPTYTCCCHICLSKVNQFAAPNTKVIVYPLITKDSEIPFAMKKVITRNIHDLIPKLFDYQTEDAFAYMRSRTKPDGMYESSSPAEIQARIDEKLKELFGKKVRLPLNGEVTWLVNQLPPDNRHQHIGTLLGLARNQHHVNNISHGLGGVEASIVRSVAENKERYFLSVSAFKGSKRDYVAHLEAMSNAKRLFWGSRTTHTFIMGDPVLPGRVRMLPVLDDLYEITKRSHRELDLQSGVEVPKMKILAYGPCLPGTEFKLDDRPLKKVTSTEIHDPSTIVTFDLENVISKDLIFVAPKGRLTSNPPAR